MWRHDTGPVGRRREDRTRAKGGSSVIDPSVRVNLTQLESLGYPPWVGFSETPTCTGFFFNLSNPLLSLLSASLELDCACFQCVLPHFVHLQGLIRSRSTDAWDTDGANLWLDTRQTDEQKDEQEITWSLPFTIYFIWSGARRWLPLEGSTFLGGGGWAFVLCLGIPHPVFLSLSACPVSGSLLFALYLSVPIAQVLILLSGRPRCFTPKGRHDFFLNRAARNNETM